MQSDSSLNNVVVSENDNATSVNESQPDNLSINKVKQDNATIHFLKAFAIIVVVFAHSLVWYSTNFGYEDNYFYKLAISILSVTHIPIFFAISGFLSHEQKIGNYIVKKVFRIIIPFIFFSTLKILYSYFFEKEMIHGEGFFGVFLEYYIIGSGYWFIYALFFVYLIGIFLWRFDLKRLIAVLILSILLATIIDFINPTFDNYFQITNIVYYLPFFIVGMVYNKLRFIPKFKIKIKIALIVILVAYISISKVLIARYIDHFYLLSFINSTALVFLFSILFSFFRKIPFVIKMISNYSLQIMFLDSFFKVILFKILTMFLNSNPIIIPLEFLFDLTLCCVVSLVVSYIPVVSFLFGLKWKKINFRRAQ